VEAPQDEVARRDGAPVHDPGPLHHPHREAGQVVLPGRVEAGQLGRLPPDEGAAGLPAPLRDPLHHLGPLVGGEAAGGEVVEEEEGLGPDHRHVVDAHGHQVDPDRVVSGGGEGHLELGAHPVGPGDEHRLAPALHVEGEEAAEPADPGQDLRPQGGAGQGLQPLHEAIALVHVDARVAVGARHGPPYRDRGAAARRSFGGGGRADGSLTRGPEVG
jgi:hypothetical protein